jgi:flagellar hook protein FlgE
MSLSSVFSTAISGMSVAQTTIDLEGNNVANANTIGFKASNAVFATQFLQTLGIGSAPSDAGGGSNPQQTGLGAQVAGVNPNFTQGTLQTTSNPSDLAIQGDGFFVVQGANGQQLYTRSGNFQLNSNNELTTSSGSRLMGFGVNSNYQVQATTLQPLTIPLGAASVAKATTNVSMEGTLSPTGNVADTAQIIESQILGDAAFTAPTTGTQLGLAPVPDVSTTTAAPGSSGSGNLTSSAAYSYKVVFVDSSGTESTASATVPVTMGASDNEVTLNNIPTDSSSKYVARNIYRTAANGSTYKLVGTISDNTTTSFVDDTADTSLGKSLNTSSLSGNYTYYVTFANAAGGPGTGVESRPVQVGPLNVVNGRIQLTNLPVDTSGQWSYLRIYRNSATDSSTFNYVGEVQDLPGQTYTDSASDASIANNAKIDLNGPRATSNTLLVNLLAQNASGTEHLFQAGTLNFTGTKGQRTLATKSLQITNTTTLLDLTTFMEQSLGIQKPPGGDPLNPIPKDSSGATPGGSVTSNGQIQLVSNNGVDNSVSADLSAFQLTTPSGTQQVDLQFGTTQAAKGNSAVADFLVYDSLGIPINVRVTAVLQSLNGTESTYRWFADSSDNDPSSGSEIAVGSGLITFDGQGKFNSATNTAVNILRTHVPASSPLSFNLDFSHLSGLSASTSSLAATSQDGFPPGKLSSYEIGNDGTITGIFDNGTQRALGQVQLARFANNDGLQQMGQNLYAAGVNSGLPVVAPPGAAGIGSITAGAVELSNTDIGQSLISLITASTQYQANSKVILTAQQLLTDLLNIQR